LIHHLNTKHRKLFNKYNAIIGVISRINDQLILKKYLTFFVFIATTNIAFGQQLSHYSQYMHNSLLLNPAIAGLEGNIEGQISNRSQWVGFDGGPKTYYLSVHGEVRGMTPKSSCLMLTKPSMASSSRYYLSKIPNSLRQGIGGTIIADQYGLFSKTSGYASYALHIPLNVKNERAKYNLSVGISVGMSNIKFNGGSSTIPNPEEETYIDFTTQKFYINYLDMNAGLWFYSELYYIGYATNQLLKDKVKFGDFPPGTGLLNVHHFITAGYQYRVNDDFTLVPSVMVKLVQPAPASYDFNVKLLYRQYIWGGISYRHKDAVSGLLGITLNDKVYIGYSYDMTTSDLKSYNSGSHEVILGVKFAQSKQVRARASF